MWLSQKLIDAVDEEIDSVFYLSYAATRLFNEHREPGQPMVFSGWYWAKGTLEGGPFKSKSSAWRDAFFRLVVKRAPPRVQATQQAFEQAESRKIARQRRQARQVGSSEVAA